MIMIGYERGTVRNRQKLITAYRREPIRKTVPITNLTDRPALLSDVVAATICDLLTIAGNDGTKNRECHRTENTSDGQSPTDGSYYNYT